MGEELDRLRRRIDELGGDAAYPVVPLDLFFTGNDDAASIGPNLDPHPGVQTFHRVLRSIRDRSDVSDVVLQVNEVLEGEDEWPYVDAAYVVTSASAEEVHEWAVELSPDPPEPEATWLYESRRRARRLSRRDIAS